MVFTGIKAMNNPKNYWLASMQGSNYLHYNLHFEKLAYKRYQDFYMLKNRSKVENHIPKIIHFIWLGGKLPTIYNFCVKSWQKHHPGWKIVIWNDQMAQKFNFKNKDIFNAVSNFGAKADILRLEILDQFGGLYVDIDFFCLQPIDYYTNRTSLLIGKAVGSMVGNGLIGASKNNDFIRQAIKEIYLSYQDIKSGAKIDLDAGQIINSFGPYFITKKLQNYLEKDPSNFKNLLILPQSYLHPFPNELRESFWSYHRSLVDVIKQYAYPETIAIHLWSVSWLAKKDDFLAEFKPNQNCDHLIFAIQKNQFKIAELLLRNGHDPNITDSAGNSPLFYAAINNRVDLGRLLILYGADPFVINGPNQANFLALITSL